MQDTTTDRTHTRKRKPQSKRITTISRALQAYKLWRELSYEALAQDMRKHGIRVSWRTLYSVINGDGIPTDRTVIKVRHFLEIVTAEKKTRQGMEQTDRLQWDSSDLI